MIGGLSKAMDIIAIKRDREVREKIVSIKVREESELLEDNHVMEVQEVEVTPEPKETFVNYDKPIIVKRRR